MTICAGTCGRDLMPKRTWECLTLAEREEARRGNEGPRYTATMCKSCATEPAEPRGEERRALRGDVLERWELAGKPRRRTPEFDALADDLGIRTESLKRTLQRNGAL